MRAPSIPGRLCSVTVLFFTVSPALAGDGEDTHIRIGSFNIANFGSSTEKAYERSLIDLVNIIRRTDADLICLQEVEPGEFGAKQVERLTKLLNVAAKYYKTPAYDFVVSTEHTGDEVIAFLWRDPVSLESEITLLEHEEDPDGDAKRTFQRVPAYAFFRAGNFDFYVVNCHLYTKLWNGSSEGRAEEYDAIVKWLQDLAGEEEKDAVVVGDFNRFLNGSAYPVKGGWSRLMIAGHEAHFRFPLLEGIKGAAPSFDPLKDSAPADEYSTTTSKRLAIYDQILVSKGAYQEFVGSPKLGENVGIVVFDDAPAYEWFIGKWSYATRMLSDHRPIWIRMSIDGADDD